MKNYYKILEVSKDIDFSIIKKNYYRLAMQYHPDKNKNKKESEIKFKELVEAYEVLSNPLKRRQYDISIKKKETFNFDLSQNIYNFSKLFFSKENINKFQNIAGKLSSNINNIGININFEVLLNTFLNNIRQEKYNNLYSEFNNFKKFYDYDVKHNNEFDIKEKYYNKRNDLKKNRPLNKEIIKKNIPKKNINKKFINININVNLSNIYNRSIKYVPININKPCMGCKGRGEFIKKNIKTEKCNKCDGKMFYIINKKFTIDTSVDKICYLNEHYISYKEGYYDIIFTIIQKPHEFIKKKNRYDLIMDKEINLYEYYYGGDFNLNYLDGIIYNIKFNEFNNNMMTNIIKKKNMGLLFIDENKRYNNDKDIMINKNDCIIRGDLYINLKIKLPIYNSFELKNNKEKIKEFI